MHSSVTTEAEIKEESRDRDRLRAANGVCGNCPGEIAHALGADAGGDHDRLDLRGALQRQSRDRE
jgi:hypothetical protein